MLFFFQNVLSKRYNPENHSLDLSDFGLDDGWSFLLFYCSVFWFYNFSKKFKWFLLFFIVHCLFSYLRLHLSSWLDNFSYSFSFGKFRILIHICNRRFQTFYQRYLDIFFLLEFRSKSLYFSLCQNNIMMAVIELIDTCYGSITSLSVKVSGSLFFSGNIKSKML